MSSWIDPRPGPRVGGWILAMLPLVVFLSAGVDAQEASDPCTGAEPALLLAGKALDTGRWKDAEELLDPLAASHSGCALVLIERARLLAARGDPAEAERLFATAMVEAPDDPLVHARFAEFQLSRGLDRQAAYLAAQALTLDPDDSEALVVQGRLLVREGRIPEARQALERALAIDPDDSEAHYQLGVWFVQIHRFDRAVACFERAIGLRPQVTRFHDHLAVSFEMLGESGDADSRYREALKINEGPFFDPFLDYNFGRFLLKQNRLEESRRHLDRAVGLLPQRRGPRYERAKLNLAVENYGAARTDAERALKLRDPTGQVLDVQLYYLLSIIHSRLGDTKLAGKYAELAKTTEIPGQATEGPR